jgi:hypothetical protein
MRRRAPPGRLRITTALCAGFCLALCSPAALAQSPQGGGVPIPTLAEGTTIGEVRVTLADDGGNPARGRAAAARLGETLKDLEGRSFNRGLIERRLAAAGARLGVGRIDYRLLPSPRPGEVALAVEIDLSATSPARPQPLTLIENDRLYLTAILAGGFGVYSDPNVWFGRPDLFLNRNPLAGRRPGRAPAWTEGFVEFGLGGAAQLADSPFYVYGALTGLTSWSLGQDFLRADARSVTGVEKAYGGLLYVDPATGNSLNLSLGRQTVTLNDGFLIHFVRGAANAGVRGASYIGARTANDFSAVAEGRMGPLSFKAFFIDPNELPLVDSRSTFAGLNLRYAITPTLSVDGSYITVPRSTSTSATPDGRRLPREGLQTVAGGLRWNKAFGIEGMWLASEIAHQTHDRYAMSAWAGYGLIGYQATHLPWSPSLSYRYSYASGDNPSTQRYERFDSLLSTGLGNWLQGVVFGKVTLNENLAVHRLQFNLQPTPVLNITFDWHLLRAPERNNLGSNPAIAKLTSQDIGQEFSITGRWAMNRNVYLQTIASVGVPGKALRDAGATKTWTTLQASLYWTF